MALVKGWLIALMPVLLGGCFSPSYPEGLACTSGGSCPSDLVCKFEQCVKAGTDNTPDAMVPCTPGMGTKTFQPTGEIEDWSVPTCISSLIISVKGAAGGGTGPGANSRGWGAIQKGEFLVGDGGPIHKGDILRILVGKSGVNATDVSGSPGPESGASGGGGSFVIAANGEPLIVSGGGGGATYKDTDPFYDYGGGSFANPVMAAGENGQGTGAGLGGLDGNGGMTASIGALHAGTGGGGFKTGGQGDSMGDVGTYGTANKPGASFADGGSGGEAGEHGRAGGFGGGGAGGATGGGGGGYSGGGAGGTPTATSEIAGGVGGSVNYGMSPPQIDWSQMGDGSVTIQWIP